MSKPAPGLEVDQQIRVEIELAEGVEEQQGRVQTIADDRIVVVADNGPPRSVTTGTPVRAVYFDRWGLYTFDTEVAEPLEDDGDSIVLAAPARVQRTQRRSYVRLDVNLPVSCLALDELTNLFEPVTARTGDIGGGGVRLVASSALAQTTQVVVSVVVPGFGSVVALGKVVAADQRDRWTNDLRVAFTLVSDDDREHIVRYVSHELPRRGA